MVRDLVDDRLMRSVQLWAAVAATDEYAAATSVMAMSRRRSLSSVSR